MRSELKKILKPHWILNKNLKIIIMKFRFTLFCFILFLIVSCIYSQPKLNVKAGFDNTFRYGSGDEFYNGALRSKEYLEEVGNGRISINDVTFGFRIELDDPREYGNNYQGISKRYIEYKSGNTVNIRAGNFFEVIGRGLTLNTFENRNLSYDTGLDGFRAIFKQNIGTTKNPFNIGAEVLAGDMEYSDVLTPTRIEKYKIRDANLEISPFKWITIGGNYVHAIGDVPSSSGNYLTHLTADLPEGYINIDYAGFKFFTSYAHKHVITDSSRLYPIPMSSDGDGLYSSLSYSKNKIGVTFEYKNYRFDLTAPNYQSSERPTKMLPFQNPPTAVREQTWTLMSREPHTPNFNDEVGGQLEITYLPMKDFTLLFNTSVSSRHYSYTPYDSASQTYYRRDDRSSGFLPSFDNKFYPWWQVYAEAEYYFNDKLYGKLALSKQSQVTYNYSSPLASEQQFAFNIPTEWHYTFLPGYTIKLIVETQFVHNSARRPENQDFRDQLVSLSLVKSPDLTFTVNGEWTTDNEEPTGKSKWYFGEVSYNINSANVLTMSYGNERGGMRCTSGICRFINPFEGFRFTLQSKF